MRSRTTNTNQIHMQHTSLSLPPRSRPNSSKLRHARFREGHLLDSRTSAGQATSSPQSLPYSKALNAHSCPGSPRVLPGAAAIPRHRHTGRFSPASTFSGNAGDCSVHDCPPLAQNPTQTTGSPPRGPEDTHLFTHFPPVASSPDPGSRQTPSEVPRGSREEKKPPGAENSPARASVRTEQVRPLAHAAGAKGGARSSRSPRVPAGSHPHGHRRQFRAIPRPPPPPPRQNALVSLWETFE